jgi:hypothetical protein
MAKGQKGFYRRESAVATCRSKVPERLLEPLQVVESYRLQGLPYPTQKFGSVGCVRTLCVARPTMQPHGDKLGVSYRGEAVGGRLDRIRDNISYHCFKKSCIRHICAEP